MKYKIKKVSIRQDNSGNFKDEFFVDDMSGKNIRVFSTLSEAEKFVSEN